MDMKLYDEPILFGHKLRSLRVERKIVQRELAEKLNIDTPMFSKIELGVRRAKRSQVVQLAKPLNVSEKELLTLCAGERRQIEQGEERCHVFLSLLISVH